jgi:hypothetical protein
MSMKMKSISALFIALIIILIVSPRTIHNVYNSILGRVVLIGIVIFFSMNNLTLGLLIALAVIAASNQFAPFVEGMETIGEDNTTVKGTQPVLTGDAAKKLEEAKKKAEELGVDKEDIKNAIASKESKSIPLDPNSKNSEEVSPFKSSMLTNSSSLTEGFCPCAASVF